MIQKILMKDYGESINSCSLSKIGIPLGEEKGEDVGPGHWIDIIEDQDHLILETDLILTETPETVLIVTETPETVLDTEKTQVIGITERSREGQESMKDQGLQRLKWAPGTNTNCL